MSRCTMPRLCRYLRGQTCRQSACIPSRIARKIAARSRRAQQHRHAPQRLCHRARGCARLRLGQAIRLLCCAVQWLVPVRRVARAAGVDARAHQRQQRARAALREQATAARLEYDIAQRDDAAVACRRQRGSLKQRARQARASLVRAAVGVYAPAGAAGSSANGTACSSRRRLTLPPAARPCARALRPGRARRRRCLAQRRLCSRPATGRRSALSVRRRGSACVQRTHAQPSPSASAQREAGRRAALRVSHRVVERLRALETCIVSALAQGTGAGNASRLLRCSYGGHQLRALRTVQLLGRLLRVAAVRAAVAVIITKCRRSSQLRMHSCCMHCHEQRMNSL